jgi:hypothetical protein
MEQEESPAGFSPQEKERMMRGFEAWLDRAMTDEPPPQGLTAELLAALERGDPLPPLQGEQPGGGCDLYSLWSAMTALTQEVRLQGRTFKQLHETLLENAENAQNQEDSTHQDAENASLKGAPLQPVEVRKLCQHEIQLPLDVVLDLRDRLERGGNTVRNAAVELAPARLPRWARWLGTGGRYTRQTQEILAALSHGYSLTLATLDEVLVNCGVGLIVCQGRSFDPQRMTALDVHVTDSVLEGTVVEVYRNGYEWNGEVHRTAQVKVARNPERKSA